MSKSLPKQPGQTDLFGEVLREPLPLRKIVARPDGRGFTIAVRESDSSAYRYVGIYSTRGEAAEALREGVGKPPPEDRETLSLRVYRPPR